jgi:hypothetical protein
MSEVTDSGLVAASCVLGNLASLACPESLAARCQGREAVREALALCILYGVMLALVLLAYGGFIPWQW